MKNRYVRVVLALAAMTLTSAMIGACGSSKTSSAANSADRAFVQQMIPHHMMAVQMAQTAERHASHAQIETLAASIISTQDAEIAQMKPIAKTLGVRPATMPSGARTNPQMMSDAQNLGIAMNQMGMSMNMTSLATRRPFDRAFIDMMIPHHQGAVRMAQAELAKGKNAQLRAIATSIIHAQDHEITEMNQWRTQWYGAASPAGGVPTT
jgi:uncharacterized protein (DUF305 family)